MDEFSNVVLLSSITIHISGLNNILVIGEVAFSSLKTLYPVMSLKIRKYETSTAYVS